MCAIGYQIVTGPGFSASMVEVEMLRIFSENTRVEPLPSVNPEARLAVVVTDSGTILFPRAIPRFTCARYRRVKRMGGNDTVTVHKF